MSVCAVEVMYALRKHSEISYISRLPATLFVFTLLLVDPKITCGGKQQLCAKELMFCMLILGNILVTKLMQLYTSLHAN